MVSHCATIPSDPLEVDFVDGNNNVVIVRTNILVVLVYFSI